MALINCPECGNEVSDQAAVCPNCGVSIKKQEVAFCSKCGKEIDKEAVICPLCGVPTAQFHQQQQQTQMPPQPINVNVSNVNTNANINTNLNQNMIGGMHGRPKNKWVSLVLCFFIGFFGAHKFYEGKIGMGILYILTVGLFMVGVIIDFIRLLFKPNPYYIY